MSAEFEQSADLHRPPGVGNEHAAGALPEHVGDYHVISRLGSGGQGDILLASDQFGNKVALKLLGGNSLHNERTVRRFMNEARTLAMLKHRNICRIFGVEQHEGKPYMVMEYVEGVSLGHLMRFISHAESTIHVGAAQDSSTELRSLIDHVRAMHERHGQELDQMLVPPSARRPFPLQQCLAIIERLSDAVQYAHEHGVLHRDIKPANVIIRPDGEPVLLDFGLARWERSEEMVTAAGEVFGTVDYMSPEQAESSHDVDERTDVYSIGALMYELLTGQRFFITTGNVLQDLKRLNDFEPIPPRKANHHIDKDIEAIVLKATTADRSRRYRAVGQIAADIRRFRNGEAITARRPSAAYRLARLARRYRTPLVYGLMVTALALIAGGYAAWDYYRTWGAWVPMFAEDFRDGAYDTSALHFVRGEIGGGYSSVAPWAADSSGLAPRPHEWCWLGEVRLDSDVRLDITMRTEGLLDGLEAVINGSDENAPAWWQVPAGYSCQVGGYSGTLDFVSINREPGDIRPVSAAVSRHTSGREVRVSFQRKGTRVILFVNGRLQVEDTDPYPQLRRGQGRIGFHSYALESKIIRVAVYRRSLPQRASPLVAGESLRGMGHARDAVDTYLRIAHDYSGKALEEDALFAAFAAAWDMSSALERGPVLDSVVTLLAERFPRSRFWAAVRERQIAEQWRNGQCEDVLRVLPSHYATYPATRAAIDLGRIPPGTRDCSAMLYPWILRTQGLSILIADRQGPQSLAGIGHLLPVGVSCIHSMLSTLEGLSRLKLCWVNIGFNGITDLGPLEGQPVRYLSIESNTVTSLEALAGMPLLRFEANYNQIDNLRPLAGAPLEVLLIGNNRISDLHGLEGKQLRVLSANGNSITSIEPLRGQPLRQLHLMRNPIIDISPIAGMPLEELSLSGSAIGTYDALGTLRLITFYGNRISPRAIPLLDGSRLHTLSLDNCSLLSLDALSHFQLRDLSVASNSLRSLEPLAGTSIQRLNCADNQIESLMPLAGTNLSGLDCANNPLRSLEPFVTIQPPPAEFFFYSADLPIAELDRTISEWSRRGVSDEHIREARIARAINAGHSHELRALARDRFLLVKATMSRAKAVSLAEASGARLATFTSEKEYEAAKREVQQRICWIGLTGRAGEVVWDSGESAAFVSGRFPLPYDSLFAMFTYGVTRVSQDEELFTLLEWDE